MAPVIFPDAPTGGSPNPTSRQSILPPESSRKNAEQKDPHQGSIRT